MPLMGCQKSAMKLLQLYYEIPPFPNDSNGTQQKPVISLFLDEAKCLGIPWVLAITDPYQLC
ncbi:lipase class 3 family protein, putative [Medicago truncatula]|uniref:Lipase class 3 family protein, putative n=1 Tax=Medicago truncatula TaxID=3880 RepID=G7L178_MEDTR|nr:lipase class 3 family protein, putative [Medicago truncatula]